MQKEFIFRHALFLEGVVPREVCKDLIFNPKTKKVWKYIQNFIPLKCDGEKFLGPGEAELITIPPSFKKNKKY